MDPWVYDEANETYVPFLIESDANFITLHSKQQPFKFDKNACTIAVYENIDNLIDGNSPLIVGQEYWSVAVKELGVAGWTELDVLALPCTFETSNVNGDLSLTVTRTAPQGVLDVNYFIPYGGELKISADFTNLNDNWDNHKFRFIENFIDVNINHFDYVNENGFNRIQNILSNDRSEFISYDDIPDKAVSFIKGTLSPFIVNVESSYEDFQGITVDVESGQLDLGFVYGRGQGQLIKDATMSIDPTFGFTAGTAYQTRSNTASGTNCPTSSFSTGTATSFYIPKSSIVSWCIKVAYEWDITSITDGSTIDDVDIDWTGGTMQVARNCDINQMSTQPSTLNGQDLSDDIIDGNKYIDNNTTCKNTSGTLDLGTSADSDLEGLLTSDWFAVGIHAENYLTRNSQNHKNDFAGMRLQVDYTLGNPSISVSDGIIIGDSSSEALTIDKQVSDGAIIGDSSVESLGLSINESDGIIIGDSSNEVVSGTKTANVSDGIIIGDSSDETVMGPLSVNVSDGIIIGDSSNEVVTGPKTANVSDGIIIGDSINVNIFGDIPLSISDGIIIGDSESHQIGCDVTCTKNVSDGIIAGDSIQTETTITTYNSIKLYVNSPATDRLGGVFAQSCTAGFYVSGIDTTGAIICTVLP